MQTWLGYLFFGVIIGGGQIAAADAPLDAIIKGGTVCDGTGGEGQVRAVANRVERTVGVGVETSAVVQVTIATRGRVVYAGCINILDVATEMVLEGGHTDRQRGTG